MGAAVLGAKITATGSGSIMEPKEKSTNLYLFWMLKSVTWWKKIKCILFHRRHYNQYWLHTYGEMSRPTCFCDRCGRHWS